MSSSRSWLVGLAVLGACGLPEYESEHAVIITDEVDRVCAGTLARVDRTIEYVDAELGRETDAEPVRIHVLEAIDVAGPCERSVLGCLSDGEVYLRRSSFEETLAHEVVHERVEQSPARNSPALFCEGIASALGRAKRMPDDDDVPPSVDEMLRASAGHELAELRDGYYHAGELTHWLIETHGMPAVLEFMAALQRGDSPNRIRKVYAAHFGTSLDADLFVHERQDSELSREQLVCTGPELTRDADRPRFRLEADLRCDSEDVHNMWVFRDRVYVEWTIVIDEADAGFWVPVRFSGDEAIPDGTMIEIDACGRDHWRRKLWTHSKNEAVLLEPRLYRVRWIGPMDGEHELKLDLAGPCDPAAPNCADGEQCVAPGICMPSI